MITDLMCWISVGGYRKEEGPSHPLAYYIRRIFRIFCGNPRRQDVSDDQLYMRFDHFVDMADTLHPDADFDAKAEILFRMIDRHNEGFLTKSDVKQYVDSLISSKENIDLFMMSVPNPTDGTVGAPNEEVFVDERITIVERVCDFHIDDPFSLLHLRFQKTRIRFFVSRVGAIYLFSLSCLLPCIFLCFSRDCKTSIGWFGLLEKVFEEADVDGTGYISFDDFKVVSSLSDMMFVTSRPLDIVRASMKRICPLLSILFFCYIYIFSLLLCLGTWSLFCCARYCVELLSCKGWLFFLCL